MKRSRGDADVLGRELARPRVHFAPQKNWMNDPCGLLWHEGRYHMYFQCNPKGRKWGHMSWGHAVSSDLLHWEELPVAISCDDQGVIFTGSVVVDRGLVAAVYTRHHKTRGLRRETQCLAYSHDGGVSFEKFAGNPVLDLDLADFRDPHVFRHQGRWIMVVARPRRRQLCFFSSDDLRSWAHESDVFLHESGGKVECPHLFCLSEQGPWVLLVSISGAGVGRGVVYYTGSFCGKTFIKTWGPRRMDHGDFFAGRTLQVHDRCIYIGWVDGRQHPCAPWSHCMSLPRELVFEDGQLEQRPVREFQEFLVLQQGEVFEKTHLRIDCREGRVAVTTRDTVLTVQMVGSQVIVALDVTTVEVFTGGCCLTSVAFESESIQAN